MRNGWLASLVGIALAASNASAQQYVSPVTRLPLGNAPNTFGPGFYVVCPDGQIIGPNYYVYPPFPPYNGVRPTVVPYKVAGEPNYQFRIAPPPQPLPRLPAPTQLNPLEPFPGGPNANLDVYPYHPFVRSPRDFFMFRETMEEQARSLRPNLVP